MADRRKNSHMILYRGSLKSCNYRCSYCPFSKRAMSKGELEKDEEQWDSFVRSLAEKGHALGVGALMVVPYGEALIHPWYWEGFARISGLSFMDGVGAQTNLSFSVEEALEGFRKAGGKVEKLRVWATFHPEMTRPEEFARKCRALKSLGAVVCAGAVGVPQNLEIIRRLKRELPEDIYLWINKMDGLGRPYTREEKEEFLEIDPYFLRELASVPSDVTQCEGRLFVEGNGGLRTCNIGPLLEERWEDICKKVVEEVEASPSGLTAAGWNKGKSGQENEEWKKERGVFPVSKCGRKRCSCYLAYGGRKNYWNGMLFGQYPLYRLPKRPKAVFLDIDGTLLPGDDAGMKPVLDRGMGKGASLSKQAVPAIVQAGLEGLYREGIPLFFATALPIKDAKRRCRKIWPLFRGGIFAGGSHLLMKEALVKGTDRERGAEEGEREVFHYMEESVLKELELLKQKYFFRILPVRNDKKLYKVTLLRPSHKAWEEREAGELFGTLREEVVYGMRYFVEDNCLQIVAKEATKANGVKELCRWMKIAPKEIFAAGNSKEDEEMMKLCLGKENCWADIIDGGSKEMESERLNRTMTIID